MLPPHLRADLRDGINPARVLSVYCKVCGEYVGRYSEIEDLKDEDDYVCKECEDE